VHSRLSVGAVSSWQQSFADDLAMWERLGVSHVALSLRKCEEFGLDASVQALRRRDLRVSNVGECGWCALDESWSWRAQQDRLRAAMEHFDTPFVLTTGPRGGLEWDAAADAFATFVAPLRNVVVENTSPLRVDLSFVNALADAIAVAERADVGVCVELNSCWMERGIYDALASDRVAHVQVSDWKIGSLATPDRRVPGDGDIPLDRIVAALADSGYAGAFELELVGPAIEAEGYEPAIARAVAACDALLGEAFADGGDQSLH
jgi:sugar phosphate isomerase/epimerase